MKKVHSTLLASGNLVPVTKLCERFIKTFKEEFAWVRLYESIQHTLRAACLDPQLQQPTAAPGPELQYSNPIPPTTMQKRSLNIDQGCPTSKGALLDFRLHGKGHEGMRVLSLWQLTALVVSLLVAACGVSSPVVHHGILTPPSVERGGASIFTSGLSGRDSDALIVILGRDAPGLSRMLALRSQEVRKSFVFPRDFTECSSWLSSEHADKQAFLVRVGDGFSASRDDPLEVTKVGFQDDVEIRLWRLPSWYLKRDP